MENLFRKLKDFKRTALRSAKTDTSFTAMIYATAEPSPHDESRQAQDNGFIERRWLPLKYECGHLHAWESGSSAKTGIGQRMTFSNHHRPASNRRENDPPDRFLIRLLPGGTPAAGFCRRPIAETRPDQPVQETARISPETVQTMGSSAVRTGFDFQRPPRLHGVMHHPAATTFTPLVKIRLTGSGHRLKE